MGVWLRAIPLSVTETRKAPKALNLFFYNMKRLIANTGFLKFSNKPTFDQGAESRLIFVSRKECRDNSAQPQMLLHKLTRESLALNICVLQWRRLKPFGLNPCKLVPLLMTN